MIFSFSYVKVVILFNFSVLIIFYSKNSMRIFKDRVKYFYYLLIEYYKKTVQMTQSKIIYERID